MCISSNYIHWVLFSSLNFTTVLSLTKLVEFMSVKNLYACSMLNLDYILICSTFCCQWVHMHYGIQTWSTFTWLLPKVFLHYIRCILKMSGLAIFKFTDYHKCWLNPAVSHTVNVVIILKNSWYICPIATVLTLYHIWQKCHKLGLPTSFIDFHLPVNKNCSVTWTL